MKLTVAAKKYFGMKEGQGLQDFAKEMAALSPKDKQDLCEMLTPVIGEPVTVE